MTDSRFGLLAAPAWVTWTRHGKEWRAAGSFDNYVDAARHAGPGGEVLPMGQQPTGGEDDPATPTYGQPCNRRLP